MEPPRQTSELLTSPHGFFGRRGGVSEGIFFSLNGSFASGDREDCILENRARMTRAFGAATVSTAKQTHSATAIFVDQPIDRSAPPEGDALITDVPGLAVGVLTADCVPLLMEAPGLVAAIHAGWRGSMRGVIGAAADLMEQRGATRSAIKVAIGPCLRRRSFEVRHDLIGEVTAAFPGAGEFFSPISEEHSLYDHIGFVRTRLCEAGILDSHIADVGGDTLGDQDSYFSYRGARSAGLLQFGHNLSAIALAQ
ncbi:MAG: polyphenol oxidase family protein [Pseudomonadota bacterium]